MRSLGTSRRFAVLGLAIAAAFVGATGAAAVHASQVNRTSTTPVASPVAQVRGDAPPLRFEPLVVTAPDSLVRIAHSITAISTMELSRHAVSRPASDQQHGRSAFELLSAFAAIGATSSSGDGKKRTSKRASKRGGSKTATDAGDGSTVVGGGTIPQSDADAAFNRATSAGGTPAAQTSTRSAAGRAAAPKKFDETVPGGRYKGTDGKYRSADGALHEDQKSEE